jgi:4-hydroxy-4-methyl-2-oxoglutarate aldolase
MVWAPVKFLMLWMRSVSPARSRASLVWGDLLTITAHRRGLGGTVIDGICRDAARALVLGYPIYARGHWMRTGKDRVQVDEIQGPVRCGGTRIEPGDLLLGDGDGDGVLTIPAAQAGEVLNTARAIAAAERTIRERIESGDDLRDARAATGYHTLQSRPQGGHSG